MKLVIGISGPKESGKDTFCHILQSKINGLQQESIAGKLKQACMSIIDMGEAHFTDQDLKEIPFPEPRILTEEMVEAALKFFNKEQHLETVLTILYRNSMMGMEMKTPREVMQILGTDVLRTVDGLIHCKSVKLKSDKTCITDVRFLNEFEFFSKKDNINYHAIYMLRDKAEAKKANSKHSSEKEVDLFKDKCLTIDNNKDLKHLEEQADNLIKLMGV